MRGSVPIVFLVLLTCVLVMASSAAATDLDSVWSRIYDGPAGGEDVAVACAVDSVGNVFVAAHSTGDTTGRDFAVLKYNTAGDLLWDFRMDGGNARDDKPVDLDIDSDGIVYVTGSSINASMVAEWLTIALDGLGDTLWTRRFAGFSGIGAVPNALSAFNGTGGGVCVAGYTVGSVSLWDMLTIRYESNGDTAWARAVNGTSNSLDEARDVTTDHLGNVYVVGYGWYALIGESLVGIKYDANGVQNWIRGYNGPGSGTDRAEAVAVDAIGNVYATGDSWNGGFSDIVTIRWDGAGVEQWARRYDGPGAGHDLGGRIRLDPVGDVIVTGSSLGDTTGIDIVTLKYASGGSRLWTARHTSPGVEIDRPRDLTIDDLGSAYIVGAENERMISLQYDADGNLLWSAGYKRATPFDDEATAVARIPTGGVYTCGIGYAPSGIPDVVTIRYAINLPPVFAVPPPDTVEESACLLTRLVAADPDGDGITLAMEPTAVPNVTFVDSGDGIGGLEFCPDYDQAGTYHFTFTVFDGVAADTLVHAVTVVNVNRSPVVAEVPQQQVPEGQVLEFGILATDPDGDVPALSPDNLPANAILTDSSNGAGSVLFAPDFGQSGLHVIDIIASDGSLADTAAVDVVVIDVNRAPLWDPTGPWSVDEGDTLSVRVSASDPDGGAPALAVVTTPPNSVFVDSGNGAGSFTFTPDFDQSGVYDITFVASDGVLADSAVVAATVNNVNRPPAIAPVAPREINEGEVLDIHILATDPDGEIPSLTAEGMPLNAVFEDSGNGAGLLRFAPDFDQSGGYVVSIIASDGDLNDTLPAAITVHHVNRAPVVAAAPPQTVDENDTLAFGWSATDPDGDSLTLSTADLPANATAFDSGNGEASITFAPDFTQAGDHVILLIATDGGPADTGHATVTVNNVCICTSHGEVTGDGVTNILDVVFIIEYVFRSGPPPPVEVSCTTEGAGDWTCDGSTNILDVTGMIDYVFRTGPPVCDPCAAVTTIR